MKANMQEFLLSLQRRVKRSHVCIIDLAKVYLQSVQSHKIDSYFTKPIELFVKDMNQCYGYTLLGK